MQKLMVQYPNSIHFRVRWGFDDSGPTTDYYELYLEYFKDKRIFVYKDRWRQKVETLLVYQNVDNAMIREVTAEPEGTAHDFAHFKNVVAKRIVEPPQ